MLLKHSFGETASDFRNKTPETCHPGEWRLKWVRDSMCIAEWFKKKIYLNAVQFKG